MRHTEPPQELWSSVLGLRRVAAARLARVAAGVVGLGALAWTAAGGTSGVTRRFLAAATVTLLSFVLLRLLTPSVLGRDRLRLRRLGQRLEAASLAVPMVVGTLFVPLLVHLGLFRFLLSGRLASFDGWIRLAVWQAGLAHLVLVPLVVRFAVTVPTLPTERVREASERARVVACLAVVVAGTVPGLAWFGIPTCVIAFTAALVIPLLYQLATWLIESERVTLK